VDTTDISPVELKIGSPDAYAPVFALRVYLSVRWRTDDAKWPEWGSTRANSACLAQQRHHEERTNADGSTSESQRSIELCPAIHGDCCRHRRQTWSWTRSSMKWSAG